LFGIFVVTEYSSKESPAVPPAFPVALSYSILGSSVVVSVPEGAGRAAVEGILRGFARPASTEPLRQALYVLSGDPRGGWFVDASGDKTDQGLTLPDALAALEYRLFRDLLARADAPFHLHGAALKAPSGAFSILILGASGAGKTTLALALMARGFVPFADDMVLIEPDTLALQVFPRAFHIDGSTRALIESLPETATWSFDDMPPGYFLPAAWAEQSAPIAAIFLTSREPGESPAVTRLSIADGTSALLPYSSTLERAPKSALATAARLTGQATSYALRSGDLQTTVDLVVSQLAEPRPRSVSK
jgi:hypothetical protein